MKIFKIGMAVVLVMLLGLEFLINGSGYYGLGFYIWFGGLSCLLMIVVALLLGRLLQRRHDYYE